MLEKMIAGAIITGTLTFIGCTREEGKSVIDDNLQPSKKVLTPIKKETPKLTQHEKAKKTLIDYVNTIKPDFSMGSGIFIAVYQYPKVLKERDLVSSYRLIPYKIIREPTYFFVIDLMSRPGSMFAHPVEYVYINKETLKLEKQDADWWPEVNDKSWVLPERDKIYEKNPEKDKSWLEELKKYQKEERNR